MPVGLEISSQPLWERTTSQDYQQSAKYSFTQWCHVWGAAPSCPQEQKDLSGTPITDHCLAERARQSSGTQRQAPNASCSNPSPTTELCCAGTDRLCGNMLPPALSPGGWCVGSSAGSPASSCRGGRGVCHPGSSMQLIWGWMQPSLKAPHITSLVSRFKNGSSVPHPSDQWQ